MVANPNSLMWVHYADQHRGIVLEFDYDKPLFQDSRKKLGKRESRFGENYLGNIYDFLRRLCIEGRFLALNDMS